MGESLQPAGRKRGPVRAANEVFPLSGKGLSEVKRDFRLEREPSIVGSAHAFVVTPPTAASSASSSTETSAITISPSLSSFLFRRERVRLTRRSFGVHPVGGPPSRHFSSHQARFIILRRGPHKPLERGANDVEMTQKIAHYPRLRAAKTP